MGRVNASRQDGLRVAHLIESDGPGGAERVLADLALGLQSAGAYNLVLLPADGEGWLARQLQGSGVAIDHFRLNGPFSPACARSLAASLRRHAIDIAHSHEFSLAVYGSWASWYAGVQHVITMHGSRYYAARLRRRLAMRAAVSGSGRLVAVSRPLADDLSRDLRVPRAAIDVVPNGVRRAGAQRPALRGELRLQPDDRLLVAVGNLYPVKGHRYLIDAVALLAPQHPSLHLAICGRGDLEPALAAQARALGIADRVHLLGLRSDVANALASADIVVHPSLSEGLPLALLEAMFAARPIVASDVGEIGTVLANRGVLVPPGSAPAIACAVDRLLARPELARRLGERAQVRAAAEYDVSRMVARYADIYAGLAAARADAAAPRVTLQAWGR
jgi:glycosyltransferase involved in cell wall biosynthesis